MRRFFVKLLCDSPPGVIFLRRNINTLPHGFPSLSETFQLVRALRQASPDGESFTPSDWPVTGPLAGPLTVSWLELRSVEGLHPTEIFNSNEKRIRPSAAVRKHIHFGDWPVYCRLPTTRELMSPRRILLGERLARVHTPRPCFRNEVLIRRSRFV